ELHRAVARKRRRGGTRPAHRPAVARAKQVTRPPLPAPRRGRARHAVPRWYGLSAQTTNGLPRAGGLAAARGRSGSAGGFRMNLRVVAGVGLGFLVVPAIAGAQQETSDAERNWSAVAACGAIDNADRRLECVDRVLQQA